VAANVLKNLDVDLRKIRLEVEKLVQSGPDMVTMGKLPQTPRAKKVIEYSMEEARNLNHNYVGTEHILLGLLREQEGVAAQVLDEPRAQAGRSSRRSAQSAGARHGRRRRERGGREGRRRRRVGFAQGRQVEDAGAGQLRPRSDRTGPQNKLDPVIGREREIERAIQVLCRRTKNNPCCWAKRALARRRSSKGSPNA
jgi:ATP-dependent Clp protease ATP-binding subunit ClpC